MLIWIIAVMIKFKLAEQNNKFFNITFNFSIEFFNPSIVTNSNMVLMDKRTGFLTS